MNAGAQELPRAAARSGSGYAWYALGVLVLVYAVNFIDRSILSILAEDIKRDLRLDDAQLGFLYGTAFAVFYALFGIPFGRLADSWHRGRLIAAGLALWSSMTALSGLANGYPQLAAARIGVGIGEASASPAAYSLVADHFRPERRALALSVYASGLYIGGGLAMPIGGFLASGWNAAAARGAVPPGLAGWQVAFLAVGLPGLLLALWVLSLREPLRGQSEGRAEPVARPGAWRDFGAELVAILPPLTLLGAARRPNGLPANLALLAGVGAAAAALALLTGDRAQWIAYGLGVYAVGSWVQALRARDPAAHRLIWGTRPVMLAVAAFGSVSFVTYGAGFWGAPYALRTFYAGPDAPARLLAGLTARQEVSLTGLLNVAAQIGGVVGGGWLSDRWRRRDPRGRVAVVALSATAHALVLWPTYTADGPLGFFAWGWLACLVSSMFVGACVATLQDMVLPRMRGTVGATYLLGATMIGLALGPYATGKVAAVTGSLSVGVLALTAMLPVTLLLLRLVARDLAWTEATAPARAAAAEKEEGSDALRR